MLTRSHMSLLPRDEFFSKFLFLTSSSRDVGVGGASKWQVSTGSSIVLFVPRHLNTTIDSFSQFYSYFAFLGKFTSGIVGVQKS